MNKGSNLLKEVVYSIDITGDTMPIGSCLGLLPLLISVAYLRST